jgi:hypothetical protein
VRWLRFGDSAGDPRGFQRQREGSAPQPEEATWQGHSLARWEKQPQGRGFAGRIPSDGPGVLKVVTTGMRPGYLRRNGVPYSENATITEHFDVAPHPSGGQLLVVTTIVDDPQYLQRTFVTSTNFKKEADGSKWNPTPCITDW